MPNLGEQIAEAHAKNRARELPTVEKLLRPFPEIMATKQVAAAYGCSVSHVKRWRQKTLETGVQHGPPWFKDGDRVFYLKADVIDHMLSIRVGAEP